MTALPDSIGDCSKLEFLNVGEYCSWHGRYGYKTKFLTVSQSFRGKSMGT
jgi:hypothetical protein